MNWLRRLTMAVAVAGCSSVGFAEDPAAEAEPPTGGQTILTEIDAVLELVADAAESTTDDQASAKSSAGKYWLGVDCKPVADVLKAQLKLEQGLVVDLVLPESPAAKAGLKQFDILLKVGDTDLQTVEGLVGAIEAVGDKSVEVQMVRDGERRTLTVTPARRSEANIAVDGSSDARLDQIVRVLGVPVGSREKLELMLVRPGVAVPPERVQALKLPVGVSINIAKDGDKPARIQVRRGEKAWTVTEDTIAELPEDLRGYVSRLLGREVALQARTVKRLHREDVGRPDVAERVTLHAAPIVATRVSPASVNVERKLDEVLKKLDQVLNELRRGRADQSLDDHLKRLERANDRLVN